MVAVAVSGLLRSMLVQDHAKMEGRDAAFIRSTAFPAETDSDGSDPLRDWASIRRLNNNCLLLLSTSSAAHRILRNPCYSRIMG